MQKWRTKSGSHHLKQVKDNLKQHQTELSMQLQLELREKVQRKENNLLNNLKILLRKLLGLDKPEKDEHEDKKNWGI